MMRNTYILLGILLVFLLSCRPKIPVPKPYGYFRIELPEHAYQEFDRPDFPYAFSYPTYAKTVQEEQWQSNGEERYWLNVYFPDFDATIFLSYKRLSGTEDLEDMVEESYRLSFAHDIKADYIRTPPFETEKGLVGISFDVGGNAASAYQFLLTDTMHHFVRGALYFNVSPNIDSLRPTIDFLKVDIDRMIETFEFKRP